MVNNLHVSWDLNFQIVNTSKSVNCYQHDRHHNENEITNKNKDITTVTSIPITTWT